MTRTPERIEKLKSVLEKRQPDLTIVLENINDPHNLSACLRSCDAVGVNTVHIVYHSGQEKPDIAHKSSASAKKWLEYKHFTSVEDCYKELHNNGFKIFTTHLAKDSISLYDIDFTEKTALVFGNEHSGVSEKAVELADGNFIVPQMGMIKSLNISVACAVSLYEAFRQKMDGGHYDKPAISETDLKTQFEEWKRR